MQVTREELARQIDQARWEWLRPHLERGALIVVDALLDLAEVGERLAVDDTNAVQAWLASRMIARPTAEQIDSWNLKPQMQFSMLVVSPFVLIQDCSE